METAEIKHDLTNFFEYLLKFLNRFSVHHSRLIYRGGNMVRQTTKDHT